MESLKKKSVVIISHIYSPGPPHELEAYLKDRVRQLFFIAHPLSFVKNKPSTYRQYEDGVLTMDRSGRVWELPDLLRYLKDAIANLWFGFTRPATDITIALDNLNAATAIWLRAFGRTKEVVFYTIDYIPERFATPWLNNLYHRLDDYCVRNADFTWNLSPVMTEMREKKGIEKEYRRKQIVVPIGTHILPIEKVKKDPNLLVFMGHLREGQGAELLLEAMPAIIKKNPKIHLRLIGSGPLEAQLKKQAADLKLADAVQFTGFVPTNEEMRRLLLEGSVAVAPYVDDTKTFTRYTDPGKPKEYLAAGLPVIITRVPQFADVIDKRRAGRAIEYKAEALAEAALDLLGNKDLAGYQQRAADLAKEYTWDKVFTDAFKAIGESE